MSIYEFYITYVRTGKALLVTTHLRPLKTRLSTSTLCVEYTSSIGSVPFEIPFDIPISFLPRHGIKISLVVDPIYITASTLTDVISIPVPIPDDLPF